MFAFIIFLCMTDKNKNKSLSILDLRGISAALLLKLASVFGQSFGKSTSLGIGLKYLTFQNNLTWESLFNFLCAA